MGEVTRLAHLAYISGYSILGYHSQYGRDARDESADEIHVDFGNNKISGLGKE